MKELIVISFGRSKCGVWKEDVLSTKEVRNVHGLPLSPQRFSGITEIEGSTANLFDLAVCIGHQPFNRKRPGHALIMSETGKFEGFVYEKEAGRIEVPPGDIFPMPDHIISPVFETCVYTAGELLPIINIGPLYSRVREREWEAPEFSFTEETTRKAKSFSGAFRVFKVSGETFAVPDEMVEEAAARPGSTCRVPRTPPHVDGLVFNDNRVVAALNLARHMGLKDKAENALMLFLEKGGPGFFVDSETGVLKREVVERPMPLLASSDFLEHVLVREREIIPLLNINALVSLNPEKTFSKSYTPKSRFHAHFGKKEVKVLEFSLPGVYHSLPEAEVDDIVDSRPYRKIPGVRSIVAGVAEHKGEILPVLDLAACFGRRTVGMGPKMVLVQNGNFRALLLTGSVSEYRTLPVSEQKALPINLPHRFVYGCYPEENRVRLILNVEALTTHFDEKLVGYYFEMISQEVDIDSEEALADGISYVSLEEDEAEPEEALEGTAVAAMAGAAGVAAMAGAAETAVGAEKEEDLPPQEESREEVPEEEAEKVPASGDEALAGATAGAAETAVGAEKEEDLPPQEESREEVPEEEAEKVPASGDEALAGATAGAAETAEEVEKEEDSATREVASPILAEEARVVGEGMDEKVIRDEDVAAPPDRESRKDKTEKGPWLTRVFYVIIALLLMLALYFASVLLERRAETPHGEIIAIPEEMEETEEPAEMEVAQEEAALHTEMEETPAVVEERRPAEKRGPITVIEIDPTEGKVSMKSVESMPSNGKIYTVKKGDTLWHIAKRFTGNPFNYPRIAADSRIKNPDLIFPEQKIVIVIKTKGE